MWSFSHENSMIEEPAPSNFLQLGRDSLYQAQQMKSENIPQSIQFYRDASSYFMKAIHILTDQTTKASVVYLANTAKRNADLLEKSMNISSPGGSQPQFPLEESIAGRPAFTGSRGRVSGVSKVPRAAPVSEDEFTQDLLQLESKLAHIGIMPPSVLLREKTPQIISSSINFSTSKLEDSFLYLSVPSSQSRSVIADQSRKQESQHQTLLPSTISQKYPSPARNRSHGSPSTSKQVERQPVSGPYGGKKKSTTGATDAQRSPAYWGTTAGGFLSWATTGINTYQQPSNQKLGTQTESVASLPNPSLSVNWNDRSMILPQDESVPVDQSYSATSTGALQLLATLKRLNEEKERLERLVEKLQTEKQKDEMLKQQVEEFKKEYQQKILLIRKKLSKKVRCDNGDDVDDSSLLDGSSSKEPMADSRVNPEKFYQLEKAVHGLMEKIRQLKEENKKKDHTIRHYQQARRATELQKEEGSVRTTAHTKDREGRSIQPPRSPPSVSTIPYNHPNLSALSQRRGTSASSSTATLTTSLKREISGGGLSTMTPQQQPTRKASQPTQPSQQQQQQQQQQQANHHHR